MNLLVLSAKKCEKESDSVNLLKEALVSVVDGLNGSIVYFIFDGLKTGSIASFV